ncbi:MAG: SUF system NifU family Fe-S cluster assembly protein [Thermomicrobium sp.]|nr:SUF system NifU family Fe-S cluster assembly protein [Thermomicrobium sp.]MCS7246190.1 SUF system NifU family Fe-S cluster assembly protein [Thermomicrobium sp.]MDW7982321.1 SUF system NifU family Fe-S cluster assembly protein [Thermomicrobium sp.]
MSDLYREQILDHYQNPRNYGTLDHPDRSFEDSNPLCGDRIRIDLKIADDRIVDIRFSGRGCAISQASASILTELVKGKSLDEVRELGAQDLLDELGVPISPARRKCALLSLKVLKAAAYGLNEWPS